MSINTFTSYIPQAAIRKAETKFGINNLTDTLLAARQGDIDAINLLFYISKNVIASSFYNRFLGDKRFWRQRIAAGDDYIFAGDIYEMFLTSARDHKGILWAFDPSKYITNLDKLDDRFRYYVLMYANRRADVLNSERSSGGLVGKGSKDLQTVAFENNPEIEDTPDLSSRLSDVENQIHFEDYLKKLKQKDARMYSIIIDRVNDLPVEAIAKKNGMTVLYVKKFIRDAKRMYQEYSNSGNVLSK